jgi:hypothetical protein
LAFEPESKLTRLGPFVFSDCPSLKSVTH